jgi:hypothetical protein
MKRARVMCFFSAEKIVLMVGKMGMAVPFPFWGDRLKNKTPGGYCSPGYPSAAERLGVTDFFMRGVE